MIKKCVNSPAEKIGYEQIDMNLLAFGSLIVQLVT